MTDKICPACGSKALLEVGRCGSCGAALAAAVVRFDEAPDPMDAPRLPPEAAADGRPQASSDVAQRSAIQQRLLIGGGVVVLCVVCALLGNAWRPSATHTTVAASTPAAPALVPAVVPAAAPTPDTSPYFTAADRPRSGALFARRLADQVDMDAQIARVREVRFKLSSRAIVPEWGSDRLVPERTASAVPLGVVQRGGKPQLAVATTRCLIDYRYPTAQERPEYANLALFSGGGRTREVFRLGEPSALPGVATIDDQNDSGWTDTSRHHLAGSWGSRYFTDLSQHWEWRAAATLPIGEWATMEGVDMAVLYFPIADPGTGALEPTRNLGITDPEVTLRRLLANHTSLWGDTFTFSLVSPTCMTSMQRDVAELAAAASAAADNAALMTILAGITAVALLATGPLAPVLEPTVLGILVSIGGELANYVGTRVLSQTFIQTDFGRAIASAAWDVTGGLVLEFIRSGGVERVILAGLSPLGLDAVASDRVIETVRAFVGRPGASATVMTDAADDSMACRTGGRCIAAVQDGAGQTDLSAELLRRGLVRLDMSDERVLAQQPGLIQAARDAVADPTTRTSTTIADETYQRQVITLAARFLR